MLSKRFNIKMLTSAIVLIMTVWMSAYAALRSGSWSLNPADFRYDMSLYFCLADRSLENLDSYEIGAFLDDECCGVAEKLLLTGDESCLYLRIRSNSPDNDKIEFRIRQKGSDSYVVLKPEDGEDFIFKSNERIGMPSSPFVLARYFNVEINTGENGSVTFMDGLYKEGSKLTFKAVPNEGYHFFQWSDGYKEPDRVVSVDGDVTLTAFFEVDYYTITFRIGDEVLTSDLLAYGTEISAPEAPAKEGYTFSGWSEYPALMPAYDVEVTGHFTINTYSVTYKIDNEVADVQYYKYGTPIVVSETPEKEGHTFSGWGDVPKTMPPFDLVLGGTFDDNYYTVSFRIEGIVIYTDALAYGSHISAPEVPEKKGYTFSGWGKLPERMPASNLDVDGSYIVNSYKLTFCIGDEVVFEGPMRYGSKIIAPDAPEKHGYTFAGWGIVPPSMPASDLVFTGSYDVNLYTITFNVDGEVFSTVLLPYGSEITVPGDVPEKDGHAFSGWGDVPATMPANNLVISGTYAINHYTLLFRIGDEVLFTGEQPYGSDIAIPEVPEIEGYTFSGWGDVPVTMPASKVEITGSYNVNSYTLDFRIDDELISISHVEFGASVKVPEAPMKDGYTFVGWGVVPSHMPARDLEFTGSYSVNLYRLVVYLNDDVYMEKTLAYGSEIDVFDPILGEDQTFEGWTEEIPSVMPAHDIEIHGVVANKEPSAVVGVLEGAEFSVYSVDGVLLFKGDRNSGIMERLTPGAYIVNGKKVIIR